MLFLTHYSPFRGRGEGKNAEKRKRAEETARGAHQAARKNRERARALPPRRAAPRRESTLLNMSGRRKNKDSFPAPKGEEKESFIAYGGWYRTRTYDLFRVKEAFFL